MTLFSAASLFIVYTSYSYWDVATTAGVRTHGLTTREPGSRRHIPIAWLTESSTASRPNPLRPESATVQEAQENWIQDSESSQPSGNHAQIQPRRPFNGDYEGTNDHGVKRSEGVDDQGLDSKDETEWETDDGQPETADMDTHDQIWRSVNQ